MKFEDEKCVILIDAQLPLGLLANTAAVLGVTLGKLCSYMVGECVLDRSQKEHQGITGMPIPILKSDAHALCELREKLYEDEYQDIIVIDFTDVAQGCKAYSEYIDKMRHMDSHALQYLGIALCGPKKKVNKLTGSMPLLR